MSKRLNYYILQYKHSVLLKEALNVGILFVFPDEKEIQFVPGNLQRLKAAYSEFNPAVINTIFRSFHINIDEARSSLFRHEFFNNEKHAISQIFLPEDATALQFTQCSAVINEFERIEDAIKQFSKLLLPGMTTNKEVAPRHNEQFIVRKLSNLLFAKHKEIEQRITKNKVIKYKELKLKFEYSWGKGIVNLVRPVSFDLKEAQDIQTKSITNYGYLNFLNGYAKKHQYRFDLLVARPQNKSLYKAYDDAIEFLELADAPKRIIEENGFKQYSEETIETLLNF